LPLGGDFLSLRIKNVRESFQEQQAKNVILVCSCIQALLTQPVRSRIEVTFQFRERKFWHSGEIVLGFDWLVPERRCLPGLVANVVSERSRKETILAIRRGFVKLDFWTNLLLRTDHYLAPQVEFTADALLTHRESRRLHMDVPLAFQLTRRSR
jgi:hypothetical protein